MAGEGERFGALLAGELGYSGPYRPESLAELFSNQYTRPLMVHLLQNLGASNVLSIEEERVYEELASQGKVLGGTELQRASRPPPGAGEGGEAQPPPFLRPADTAEALLEGVARDEAEARALKARIAAMERHSAEMEVEAERLESIQAALAPGEGEGAAAGGKGHALEAVRSRSARMDAALARIQSAARSLVAAYGAAGEEKAFLLLSSLSEYQACDREYTRELNRFYAKQFQEGPARLVGQEAAAPAAPAGGGGGKAFSGWADPLLREVEGEKEAEYQARVRELKRLRSIFELSEAQYVEAVAERARHRAVEEAAEALLRAAAREESKLKQRGATHVRGLEASARGVGVPPVESTPQRVRAQQAALVEHRQAEVAAALEAARGREEGLKESVLPALLRDLSRLQDTYILEGDYDMKLLRQEYYFGRKRRFLSLLGAQHARHRLLSAALDVDKGALQQAGDLLAVASRALGREGRARARRMRAYDALREAGGKLQGGVHGIVDSRDAFLQGAGALLRSRPGGAGGAGDSAAAPSYLPLADLVSWSGAVGTDASGARQEALRRLLLEEEAVEARRAEAAGKMHALAWPGGAGGGEPRFTPPALLEAMDALDEASNALGSAIEVVAGDHAAKVETLNSLGDKLDLQRRAWVYFFLRPERLVERVEELKRGHIGHGLRI